MHYAKEGFGCRISRIRMDALYKYKPPDSIKNRSYIYNRTRWYNNVVILKTPKVYFMSVP